MTVERIDALVALAIKNNKNPYQNSFAGFIRQVLATKYQASSAVTTQELKTLNTAWRTDKWRSIIHGNPYNITEEEVEKWERNYKLASSIL